MGNTAKAQPVVAFTLSLMTLPQYEADIENFVIVFFSNVRKRTPISGLPHFLANRLAF
jgi:hypothetical protein